MKTIFIVFSCLVFAHAKFLPYLSGGELANSFGHPFLVSIQKRFPPNFMHACAGVILSDRWVLTAAACFDPSIMTEVLSGKFDLQIFETGQQRRGILVRNTELSSDRNLAMIRLASPFVFDERTNETTFAQSDQVGVPGETATLIGWPYIQNPTLEPLEQALQTGEFQIAENSVCEEAVGRPLDPRNEFCTGPTGSSLSTCFGNVGTPLIHQGDNMIIGLLLDHPFNCNSTVHWSGVYARVASYRRWIDSMLARN